MAAPSYYSSPASGFSSPAGGQGGEVPSLVIDYLRRTRPWVFLVAVLGLLMMAISLGVILTAIMATDARHSQPPLDIKTLLAVVNFVLGIFAFVRLARYASAISRLTQSRNGIELVSAIRHQRIFWKLMGISMLISILTALHDVAVMRGILVN